jgi:hypothetical protein
MDILASLMPQAAASTPTAAPTDAPAEASLVPSVSFSQVLSQVSAPWQTRYRWWYRSKSGCAGCATGLSRPRACRDARAGGRPGAAARHRADNASGGRRVEPHRR